MTACLQAIQLAAGAGIARIIVKRDSTVFTNCSDDYMSLLFMSFIEVEVVSCERVCNSGAKCCRSSQSSYGSGCFGIMMDSTWLGINLVVGDLAVPQM